MSSGSKKRNPDTHFLFLSKVPVNEPPPVSPTGLLWRELPVCKAFFYISLKFLTKISLIKKFFLFSKALGKDVPVCLGPYGKRCPFSEPYLAYPSGSPVKEPSLHVALIELHRKEMHHS
jgi:hypothetical protein